VPATQCYLPLPGRSDIPAAFTRSQLTLVLDLATVCAVAGLAANLPQVTSKQKQCRVCPVYYMGLTLDKFMCIVLCTSSFLVYLNGVNIYDIILVTYIPTCWHVDINRLFEIIPDSCKTT